MGWRAAKFSGDGALACFEGIELDDEGRRLATAICYGGDEAIHPLGEVALLLIEGGFGVLHVIPLGERNDLLDSLR